MPVEFKVKDVFRDQILQQDLAEIVAIVSADYAIKSGVLTDDVRQEWSANHPGWERREVIYVWDTVKNQTVIVPVERLEHSLNGQDAPVLLRGGHELDGG